jgi:hypothetical protein
LPGHYNLGMRVTPNSTLDVMQRMKWQNLYFKILKCIWEFDTWNFVVCIIHHGHRLSIDMVSLSLLWLLNPVHEWTIVWSMVMHRSPLWLEVKYLKLFGIIYEVCKLFQNDRPDIIKVTWHLCTFFIPLL